MATPSKTSGKKFVTQTRDKCYIIASVYSQCIRDVKTTKLTVAEKLLDVFLPYVTIWMRFARALETLQTSLKEFAEKNKDEEKVKAKQSEIDKEIKELAKQTVQIDPFFTKDEFMNLIKQEPKYSLSPGDIYSLFHYQTGEAEENS